MLRRSVTHDELNTSELQCCYVVGVLIQTRSHDELNVTSELQLKLQVHLNVMLEVHKQHICYVGVLIQTIPHDT